MKIFVASLNVLLRLLPTMIAFAAFSQRTDTICVDRVKFVKMLTKAEQAKAFEAQNELLFMQVDTLKARIVIKESIIANKDGQIADYKNIVVFKDAIIKIQEDQKKILEQNAATLNKELRKQKRKTRFTALAGLITSGFITYLLITK